MLGSLLVKLKIYTPWADVKPFSHAGIQYFLQAKRHKTTNKIKFRTTRTGALIHQNTNVDLLDLQKKIPQVK